jgi:hypothetical protein
MNQFTRDDLTGPCIPADKCEPKELLTLVRERLRQRHACYLKRFPIDVQAFVAFLSEIGTPLANYGNGKGIPAHTMHPVVNRVRYVRRDKGDAWVHERSDALPVHSARSWRSPRPSYFAMLMADPGWTDAEKGQNGESILVRWSDALSALSEFRPQQFSRDLALLTVVPIRFAADHVQEQQSTLPLVYQPVGGRGDLDLGARVKGDYDVMLRSVQLEDLTGPDRNVYWTALARFLDSASQAPARVTYAMAAGDLVLLDNDRFGHGRFPFVAERSGCPNPRELWSATIQ